MRRKIVLTGNYRQFRDYCHENHLDYRRQAVYVCSVEDVLRKVQGFRYSEEDVITTGTFWDRPWAEAVHWEVMHRADEHPQRPVTRPDDIDAMIFYDLLTAPQRRNRVLTTRSQRTGSRTAVTRPDSLRFPDWPTARAANQQRRSDPEMWMTPDAGPGVLISELLGPE